MATAAQMAANRANAQKSTGPRTVEGKARVAQNAVQHGLLAEQVVIQGEDSGVFEAYREAMLEELSPVGPIETTLAERVVGLAWRLRRAERVQAEVFDALLVNEKTNPLVKLMRSIQTKGGSSREGSNEDHLVLGRTVVRDFAKDRVLDRLCMYERRIETSLYKTMAELQKLRVMRELQPPVAEKSESRNTKSETDSNELSSTDRDEENQAELDDGERATRGLRTHPTQTTGSQEGVMAFVKQTQFSDVKAVGRVEQKACLAGGSGVYHTDKEEAVSQEE